MLSANDFPVVSYMSSAGINPVPRGLSWATNSLVVLKSWDQTSRQCKRATKLFAPLQFHGRYSLNMFKLLSRGP
jgi:hypothetical protein